ncbi:MAG: type VI secretion system lipoprotein TssJ [Woeseiaceae bacterium]|nr:type VI secretion system lipoprotein TssJ [Woeseiaceae bacterium]
MRILASKAVMLGAVFALALTAGCASGPPADVNIRGSITTVDDVNPDATGRPSPLMIRIYQLSATDKFDSAEFFDLTDNAEATLGPDLLGVEQLMLSPGESQPYDAEYDPNTSYIGVIAGYRDIHQATWRATVEMPGRSITNLMRRGAIVIRADRLAISVTVDN